MMLKIQLHPEVIKFLREAGTVWYEENEEETFIVNNTWYKPTDIKNLYTVEFLENQVKDY